MSLEKRIADLEARSGRQTADVDYRQMLRDRLDQQAARMSDQERAAAPDVSVRELVAWTKALVSDAR